MNEYEFLTVLLAAISSVATLGLFILRYLAIDHILVLKDLISDILVKI